MTNHDNIPFIRATVESSREAIKHNPLTRRMLTVSVETYCTDCETLLARIDELEGKPVQDEQKPVLVMRRQTI